MKNIYFALAILGTATIVSCVQEINDPNTTPLNENGVAFTINEGISTRSGESDAPQTNSYFLGKDESGESFFLEETIYVLNASAPITRGTPVYTENVGVLYANQLGVYGDKGGFTSDATFENMDQQPVNGGWRYQRIYATDPWPADGSEVNFYLRMPTDMTNYGVSDLEYGENCSTTFNYTSPKIATAQQDIIFAGLSLDKATHNAALPTGGTKVTLYHALTGVKFRIVNNDEVEKGKEGRTQTYITKVTITGLKNAGTCVVTPKATEIKDKVSWTLGESTGTFSQDFTEAENITAYSGSKTDSETGAKTNGAFTDKGEYPDSFASVANTNNLNDGNGSMTFWFIPQDMTEDVTMTVEFHVWSGDQNEKTKTLTLNLGERILAQSESDQSLTKSWKAGQLRTFSLKPQDVDVKITDKMNKYVKSDVKIKNTGNVSEYVRVYLIGNWVGYRQTDTGVYNEDETVLMGYTSADMNNKTEVLRWNDKDFTGTAESPTYEPWVAPGGASYPYVPYGTFVGLPPMGTTAAGGTEVNGWVRHDKFYYYTSPIGPGQQVPDTKPLFSSYTLDENKIPDFWITDNTGLKRLLAKDVHLVMDIAVQAIEAPLNEDGTPAKTYLEAWTEALNPTGDPNFNINDL